MKKSFTKPRSYFISLRPPTLPSPRFSLNFRFAFSPEAFIALQTPANEASSSVAAKSHALFQYIIRPPRESFSILAGKSLQISHFVEFRADIALSTGLIHRIPGDCVISRWISHVAMLLGLRGCHRFRISVCLPRLICISHIAVVLADNSSAKEQQVAPAALSSACAPPQPE